MNVKIITAKTFLKIKKQEHSKILMLVCQQTIEIFDDIAKKLKLNGLKDHQIINIRY